MSVNALLGAAQTRGGASDIWQLVTVLLIFCLVLVLAYFVTKYVAKVSRGTSSAANIAVIETVRVAQNKFVGILRVGRRYFVVSVGKDDIKLISELQEEDIITDKASLDSGSGLSFAKILKDVRKNLPFTNANPGDVKNDGGDGEKE